VWSERIAGRLKPWHLVCFFLGIVCDNWWTGLMFKMVGGLKYDSDGLSRLLAILLTFVHAVWATIVLVQKNERMISNFHKFSLLVWFI
jgi:uncharacterized repeat protein (TIGR03987 family)